MKRAYVILLLLLAVSFAMVCGEGEEGKPEAVAEKEEARMKITSNPLKNIAFFFRLCDNLPHLQALLYLLLSRNFYHFRI